MSELDAARRLLEALVDGVCESTDEVRFLPQTIGLPLLDGTSGYITLPVRETILNAAERLRDDGHDPAPLLKLLLPGLSTYGRIRQALAAIDRVVATQTPSKKRRRGRPPLPEEERRLDSRIYSTAPEYGSAAEQARAFGISVAERNARYDRERKRRSRLKHR